MNKAKLKQLAEEQANTAETKQTAAQRPPDASEQSGRTSSAPIVGTGLEAFQARIYTALVGGTDFSRSQAGVVALCREAYKRSKTAVEVWRNEKAKVEGKA